MKLSSSFKTLLVTLGVIAPATALAQKEEHVLETDGIASAAINTTGSQNQYNLEGSYAPEAGFGLSVGLVDEKATHAAVSLGAGDEDRTFKISAGLIGKGPSSVPSAMNRPEGALGNDVYGEGSTKPVLGLSLHGRRKLKYTGDATVILGETHSAGYRNGDLTYRGESGLAIQSDRNLQVSGRAAYGVDVSLDKAGFNVGGTLDTDVPLNTRGTSAIAELNLAADGALLSASRGQSWLGVQGGAGAGLRQRLFGGAADASLIVGTHGFTGLNLTSAAAGTAELGLNFRHGTIAGLPATAGMNVRVSKPFEHNGQPNVTAGAHLSIGSDLRHKGPQFKPKLGQ